MGVRICPLQLPLMQLPLMLSPLLELPTTTDGQPPGQPTNQAGVLL